MKGINFKPKEELTERQKEQLQKSFDARELRIKQVCDEFKVKHKGNALTEEEVNEQRSSKYETIDFSETMQKSLEASRDFVKNTPPEKLEVIMKKFDNGN